MVVIFWISSMLIIYTYLLYPLMVLVWAHLWPQPVKADVGHTPYVSMVVAAYNEEDVLEAKIENCLALDYPPDRIEFLFGSDGSSDRTDEILDSCGDPRIRGLFYPDRAGKLSVLNKVVPQARGELLVFSDANSMYDPRAVRALVSHFADPDVGGVCGRLRLMPLEDNAGSKGEGLYWRYENLIKKAEGAIRSVIGANGAIYAIRRRLFRPLPTEVALADDFLIPLRVLEDARRVTYEPRAVATENTSPDMREEFVRKVRIAAANFSALPYIAPMLSPLRGFVAWALWSHKILRWLVPFLALGALGANLLILRHGPLYVGVLIVQAMIYVGALGAYFGDRLFGRAGVLLPFYYFAMVNVALALGFWRSVTGRQEVAWKRVPR